MSDPSYGEEAPNEMEIKIFHPNTSSVLSTSNNNSDVTNYSHNSSFFSDFDDSDNLDFNEGQTIKQNNSKTFEKVENKINYFEIDQDNRNNSTDNKLIDQNINIKHNIHPINSSNSQKDEKQPINNNSKNQNGNNKNPNNNKKTKRGNTKSFIKWKQRQIDPATFVSDEEMTILNIPPFLQHVYLSGIPEPPIKAFREWQHSLFSCQEWQEGKNTIILVPTSGGKTVAADVAIAQLLAKDKRAKAILDLPFVALANEKFNEYVKRFFPYSVRAFYMNVGGNDFHRGQIAVCTFEKAHSILTSALTSGYSDKIKLVIIDEVHMIGDEMRGPVIEALIIKLLLMKNKPRIIGMTATVNKNDAVRLAKWIDGFSFISESRPSQVKQFLKNKKGELYRITPDSKLCKFHTLKSIPDDSSHLMDPIRTLLSRTPDSSIIIFVNSRNQTLKYAVSIARKLFDNNIDLPKIAPPSQDLVDSRIKLLQELTKVSGTLDNNISLCISKGIGIHHAGLLLEERKLIESAARNKILWILVATTTLSAGVNIPSISRVFIMDIYRWTPQGNVVVPSSQFTQMVGRAGRTANRPGDAFIISNTDKESEKEEIIRLCRHQIDDIVPHLKDEGQLDRFFLQCLATGLLPAKGGLVEFINRTLDGPSTPEDVAKRLIDNKLIDSTTYEATPLGRAIAGSSLSIEEGVFLSDVVTKLQRNLCLDDELHLLYLCVSPTIAETVKKEAYDSDSWLEIIQNHMHVIQLITGRKVTELERLQDLPRIYGGQGRINSELDSILDRVYVAAILLDLINETPIKIIQKKFDIERGMIQSLQMMCASFAGQTARFCELYGSVLLATTLNRFRQRLNFAARSELLGLMVLPSISKSLARIFFDCGLPSPIEIANLNVDAIAAIISPTNDKGVKLAPTEIEIATAENIFAEAREYAKSLTRIEQLEELAMQNSVDI
ncbi:DEAD/DEAH box helicase family protein [Tritrichomonas foetus]|uniref:DEAD/DEAH box helicase family protein n=1 Tax=Tritrichomonas foetus TaxID=1144522 RepID=A0A1J4L2N8_9EUKA|nr:DEAD/DEAH box helicase family protein [Tritrichomonas foetus]|eukprot:OHT16165.1 DEAD/DEAH box helicase family protein [Tritrichomonas foetus]